MKQNRNAIEKSHWNQKIFHANGNQMKVGVVISGKTDFKRKTVVRDKGVT